MNKIIKDLQSIADKLKGTVSGSGKYKKNRIKEIESVIERLGVYDRKVVDYVTSNQKRREQRRSVLQQAGSEVLNGSIN